MIAKMLPLILELLSQFADGILDGKEVKAKPDLLEGIQMFHGIMEVYGDNLELLIPGVIDKEILAKLVEFVRDLAKEGDFPVLVLAKIA